MTSVMKAVETKPIHHIPKPPFLPAVSPTHPRRVAFAMASFYSLPKRYIGRCTSPNGSSVVLVKYLQLFRTDDMATGEKIRSLGMLPFGTHDDLICQSEDHNDDQSDSILEEGVCRE
jgi:hypothetical protein